MTLDFVDALRGVGFAAAAGSVGGRITWAEAGLALSGGTGPG